MKIKEIQSLCDRITVAIDEGALKTAFDLLQSLLSGTQTCSFQNRLNELQDTYRYLLHYYAEGVKDPARNDIYASVLTGVCELADRIRHRALSDDAPQMYYACRRTAATYPQDVPDLIRELPTRYETEDREGFEHSVHLLFNKIWTGAFLGDADVPALRGALGDGDFPLSAKCQIVSALLLGLQASFDREKCYLLCDAAVAEQEPEVRIRALTALCLTLDRYRNRTAFYPGIRHRLDALAEAPDFLRIMLTVIPRFILSRETEKVTHRLQEEILPDMLKLTSKINPFDSPDLSSDAPADGMNPEWKDMLADDRLAKKIEEYSHLQEEGMDVLYSMFIHLKNYPFFHRVSNWFLPFSMQHSAFGDRAKTDTAALKTILQSPFMCNSDKYSMYLSLLKIPQERRSAMMLQIDSQLGEMNQQMMQEMKSRQNDVERIAGQYVQDLYRFYRLYPRRAEFEDIFNRRLDFHRLPALQEYFSDADTLLQIAGLYLRRGHYEDAQLIYRQLTEREAPDGTLYQKLGYCLQMTGDLQGALAAYRRAELVAPESKWLMRRIADCYRTLKQPAQALPFYRRCEQLSPDTVSVLMSIGHCHLELKNCDEALKYYFKADYLEPENHKALRAVAWCSFLTGKHGQAQHCYRKILDGQPQMQDFLNAGHTEWALENLPQALTFYQSAIGAKNSSFEKFLALFRQDIPDLVQAGVKSGEIVLMLDRLRYST
jgi:tetratricopeptide (TPR) repeat protein